MYFTPQELNSLPKHIQLVTSNPVGRKNMEAILKHEGWSYNYTTHFWEKED